MKVFLLYLCFISALPLLSQTSKIDSLSSIVSSCQPFDGDSCQTIIQNMIESAKNDANQRLYPNVLICLGNAHLSNDELDKAEQALIEAKAASDSLGDKDLIANSNIILGKSPIIIPTHHRSRKLLRCFASRTNLGLCRSRYFI